MNSKDSQYGKSLSFVQGVWDEYLTDNMFDDSMTVHIGTDEYYCILYTSQSMNEQKKSLSINVELFGRDTPAELSFSLLKN